MCFGGKKSARVSSVFVDFCPTCSEKFLKPCVALLLFKEVQSKEEKKIKNMSFINEGKV